MYNTAIGRNRLFEHIMMVMDGIRWRWVWGQEGLFVKREELMLSWNKTASHIAGPFVREIHRWSVESPLKGKWCGDLTVCLLLTWTKQRVGDARNLKRFDTRVAPS